MGYLYAFRPAILRIMFMHLLKMEHQETDLGGKHKVVYPTNVA
jgi:hypothetical protein